MLKKGRLILLVLLSMMLIATACSDQESNGKKGSGKVVLYSALNEDDTVKIQQQFKADTGIEIEFLRLNSAGEASTRVQAEKDAPQADVLIGGSLEFYTPLADQGLLESYHSPNAKDLDPMFNDEQGYFQGWYMGVLALAVNEERFAEDLAPKGVSEPKTWDDLLDPGYKDILVLPNPATAGSGYIFAATQIFRLGEDKAWEYIKNVSENVHHYVASGGDVVNLAATGEFAVGMHWAHDIVKSAGKGYPVKPVIPEYTAFEVGGAAIVKGGKNQDNAKAFIDWLLTKEFQEMHTEMSSRYSVRNDVNPPAGMVELDALTLIEYDRDKASEMKEAALAKFIEVSGGK